MNDEDSWALDMEIIARMSPRPNDQLKRYMKARRRQTHNPKTRKALKALIKHPNPQQIVRIIDARQAD